MAVFHPPIDEQAFFSTPLNEGETRIRDLLGEQLDDNWHVFVQPHLLNQQPDFLIVHKKHGPTIIEVKDWREGGHRVEDGVLEVKDPKGAWHRQSEDPLLRMQQYKANVAERFLTPPGEKKSLYGNVHTTVVLPRWKGTDADKVLRDGTKLPSGNHQWIHIAGSEIFDDEAEFWALVHGDRAAKGRPLEARVYERFLARLEEPEAVSEQRQPLRLSAGAQNVARNPQGLAVRRVRGSAGSGKTLALVARAGNLAKDGKRVLVLTYNITLANYIESLAGRWCRQIGADRRQIDIIHIHGFCADILYENGATAIDSQRLLPTNTGNAAADEEAVFDNMVIKTEMVYEQRGDELPRYDAIIVDEGQDFKLQWWNMLRQHVLRQEPGEMLLVADVSQDIYDRRGWTEDGPMRGAGFRSRWKTLSGSYRLPVDFVPILREFAERFIPDGAQLPTVPEDHLARTAQRTVRRWVNATGTEERNMGMVLRDEVRRMLEHDLGPHPADVTVLVETHLSGERVMNLLKEEKIDSEHIFSTNKEDQQNRKRRFWPGVAMLKGSTVHSFKGWESRGIVYLLQGGISDVGRFAYTALTRLKGDPANRPAFITIINLRPEMDSFKEVFERTVEPEEIDDITSGSDVIEDRAKGRVSEINGANLRVKLEQSGRTVDAVLHARRPRDWVPREGDRVQGSLVLASDADDDSEDYVLERIRFIGEELF